MSDTVEVFVLYSDSKLGPGPPVAVCTSRTAVKEAKDDNIGHLAEVANGGEETFSPEALEDQFGDMFAVAQYDVDKSSLEDADHAFVVFPDSAFAGVDEPYGVYFDQEAAVEVRDDVVADLIEELDEQVATPGKTLRETAENQIHVDRYEIRGELGEDPRDDP